MTPANLTELSTAVDRLQATVAVIKFVEQRIPNRGSDADMAAIAGLKVARERLVSLATELGSFVLAGCQAELPAETRSQLSCGLDAGATPQCEADGRAADVKAA